MVKFSLTHNTTSDILKAVFAGTTALLTALVVAAPNGFTLLEWLSAGLAAVAAAGSALGIYSADAEKDDFFEEDEPVEDVIRAYKEADRSRHRLAD